MLRTLALWLLRIIEEQLDPDLKARLVQYRNDKEQLEAQIKEAQAAISGMEGKLSQLNTQRAATQTELATAMREAERFEEERRRILNETNNSKDVSDAAALRDRL